MSPTPQDFVVLSKLAELKAASDAATAAVASVVPSIFDGLTAAASRTLLNVEDGATADQSAAEILAALLTVDGAGSGLDADLLDGNSAAAFASSSQGALADTSVQPGDSVTDLNGTAWRVFYTNGSGDLTELELGADGTYLRSNGAALAPSFTTPAGGAASPYDAFSKKSEWNASSVATVPGIYGFHTLTSVGTVTARTPAATSMATRMTRQGIVSVATAGGLASRRVPVVGMSLSDASSPPLGGFWWECRFVISDAAAVAGARMFVGPRALTSAATNVEPSTLVNCIGVGHGAADTNLKIFYGGSAAQTPIDLGANFPITHGTANVYTLSLYAPPGTANSVTYTVTRENTGDTATGTLTGGATIVPQSSTMLSMFNSYRTNNATALAVGLDISYIRVGQNV